MKRSMRSTFLILFVLLLVVAFFCVDISVTYPDEGESVEDEDEESEEDDTPELVLDTSPRETELSDVYITVKTTAKHHKSRVPVILDTWFQIASQETYFFSDADDHVFMKQSGGHLVNTHCQPSHTRLPLCCKMAVEYDYYIASQKRWFCHVDDDTYVNVRNLVQLLRQYNHAEDWYLGKPSWTHPVEVRDPDHFKAPNVTFWFATGGAGFCLSQRLALKMIPYVLGGKFENICLAIELPDDCTMGFVVYHYLKTELTVVNELHSHLEDLWKLQMPELRAQITLSYKLDNARESRNVVAALEADPTTFRTLHCYLYPESKGCPQAINT